MEFCNLEMRQHFQQLFEDQQRKVNDEENETKTDSRSPSNNNELEESSTASTSYESDLSKSCEQFTTKSKKLLHNSSDLLENEPFSFEQLQFECKTCLSHFHSLLELHDHNCLSQKKTESERLSAPPQICSTNLQQTRNSECRSVPNTLELPDFQLNEQNQTNLEVILF